MKVFKPTQLGLLTRCFEHERKYQLGVCVLAFVPLSQRDTILLSEVSMWKFAAKAMDPGQSLDATIPKVRSEFLVHGTAYAPGGKPLPRFGARAEVGALRKELSITADRVWVGDEPSEPLPITSMPLSWSRAYGGEGYDRNPLGKGRVDVEIGESGVKARPVPNIEDPRHLVLSPHDHPEPAGYGPIDIAWPQRSSLAGTYDKHWLENLYPGSAKDVDWGLHNSAPRDQQQNAEAWTPGEPYRFTNLHPEQQVLEGTLPNLRARAFAVRSHRTGEPRPRYFEQILSARRVPGGEAGATAALEEVELRLQTLWFFPDAQRAVLAWSGSIEVAEEEGADIVQLMVAGEHFGRPKPKSHYAQVLAARLDPDYGTLASLRDRDLLPENLGHLRDAPPDEDEEVFQYEGLAIANGQRLREDLHEGAMAHLESRGLDPVELGIEPPEPPEPTPSLEELPEFFEKKWAELDELERSAKGNKDEVKQRALAVVDASGPEARVILEQSLDAVEQAGQGPPTFTADGQKAELERVAAAVRAGGEVDGQLEAMLDDPSHYEQWKDAERKLMDAYRKMAHHQNPAPTMPDELHGPTRDRLRQAIEAGEDLGTLNFTGANLTGMDLRGADLRRGLFESADFSGADLRDAKLDDAVLAHATLSETQLDQASLRRTNLGKAHVIRSSFDQAHLGEAVLEQTRMEGTRMRHATLTDASVLKLEMIDCDARGIEGRALQPIEAKFDKVDFSDADLNQTMFIEQDLRACTFNRANLSDCTFLNCDLRGAAMDKADLRGARLVEETRMEDASLIEADLRGANLRGIRMARVDLRQTQLDGADLTEADLPEAKLYRAVARQTRFDVANLREASLIAANLMHATFPRATIESADFRGANLYGADMARVRTNDEVQLHDAILSRVRIHPRQQGGTS